MAEHPNATIVRKGFVAFSAGDIETLTQVIAHDAVQVMPGNNHLSGDYKGIEAILNLYGTLAAETDGAFTVTLEEVYAGGDRVAAVYRNVATRNGKSYDQRHCLVFTMLGGKAVEMVDVTEDQDKTDAFWG